MKKELTGRFTIEIGRRSISIVLLYSLKSNDPGYNYNKFFAIEAQASLLYMRLPLYQIDVKIIIMSNQYH